MKKSNTKITQGIKKIKANTNGKNFVQHKLINWSNLILGKDARIQINKKTKMDIFKPKTKPSIKPWKIHWNELKLFKVKK